MALKDIFHGKEKTESQVPPMKIFDNITEIVRDDLQKTIKKNGRVSVAAACFSMYAYQELKQQLDQVDEFRFIFTSPTFIKEKAEKLIRFCHILKEDPVFIIGTIAVLIPVTWVLYVLIRNVRKKQPAHLLELCIVLAGCFIMIGYIILQEIMKSF